MKVKFVNYRILIIVCAMIIFSGIALLHNLSVFAESNDDGTIKNQEESNVSDRMSNDLSPKETVEINEEPSDYTDNNSTLVQAKDNNPIDEGINNAKNTKENPKMGTVFNVGSAGLNLRGEPSTIGGGVILVMPENSTVKILGERNIDGRLWYNVDFNGYLGWAVADYIKINDNHVADNNTKPGSDINLSQNERERIIWDYLKSKGLSDYAISGIMGNLYAESGLNPRNVENAFELNSGYNDNSYTEAVDNGSYNNFVNDGAGYGLAQWTYYTFKQELLNRARAERLSIGDLNLQLKFLWDWIQQDYSAFQSLTSSNSVKTASDIFLKQYERPYDQSEAALIKRANYGEMYFNKYKSADTSQDDENQSEYDVSGEFFYDSDGKLRYRLKNGLYPKVGFIEKDGHKFFTYGNGYIYTNQHITFGPKIMYYMGSDGSMQIGKFRDVEGKLRYSLPDGNLIGSVGWKEDAGGKYFAHDNGYLYTNQHITFGPKIMYYMGSDGSMRIGKFRDVEGKLRYSLPDGNLIGSVGWKEDAGGKYFAHDNGYLYTNQFITFGPTVQYYCDNEGRATLYEFNGMRKGIDVSAHQQVINWDLVKTSGIEFAMIRVGYRGWGSGTIIEDKYFERNIREAKRVGIKVGVYFYSGAINTSEAIEEAQFVINKVRNYSLDYPIAFDFEDFENTESRYYKLDKNQRTDISIAFLEMVKRHGYTPMMYGNPNYFNNERYFDTSRIVTQYKVWLAHYYWADSARNQYSDFVNFLASGKKTGYSYEGKQGTIDMWQFSSEGIISGINGRVDLNISYF